MYAIRSYYGPFENAEIDERSPRIEGFAPRVGEDPIIMAVKPFAFAVKIGEEVGGGKFRLYACFVHTYR